MELSVIMVSNKRVAVSQSVGRSISALSVERNFVNYFPSPNNGKRKVTNERKFSLISLWFVDSLLAGFRSAS